MSTAKNQNVNYLYDSIDRLIMTKYEQTKKNYIDLLIDVCGRITGETSEEEFGFDVEEKVFRSLESIVFSSEEARLAMQMAIVKGFKQLNIAPDKITPDAVGLIFAFIIKHLMRDRAELCILDVTLGTGNLLTTIANHLDINDLTLMGTENDERMVRIAKANADMQDHFVDVFHQDTLQHTFRLPDVILGDLDDYDYISDNYNSFLYAKGIRHFPYLVIEHHLQSGYESSFFMFLISNDFFQRSGNKEIKEAIEEMAHMLGLIVLPETMFVSPEKAKSILLLRKKEEHENTTIPIEVFHLPSSSEIQWFRETMFALGNWLQSIR